MGVFFSSGETRAYSSDEPPVHMIEGFPDRESVLVNLAAMQAGADEHTAAVNDDACLDRQMQLLEDGVRAQILRKLGQLGYNELRAVLRFIDTEAGASRQSPRSFRTFYGEPSSTGEDV